MNKKPNRLGDMLGLGGDSLLNYEGQDLGTDLVQDHLDKLPVPGHSKEAAAIPQVQGPPAEKSRLAGLAVIADDDIMLDGLDCDLDYEPGNSTL